MLIEDSRENLSHLEDMKRTEGWKLMKAMLTDKYKAEARGLLTGPDETATDVAKRKAKCKIIKEIFQEARIAKEELNWMI